MGQPRRHLQVEREDGFDLAYTHIFGIGDDSIDRTESGVRFIGNVDSHVDIVSASMKYRFGGDDHHHAMK